MISAVIFDLDGVIVSTDECHYMAWKKLADEEGIYFDKIINNRLRGVSRMESLDIVLEKSERKYSIKEKEELATRKNNYYKEYITKLTPNDILPGVTDTLNELKKHDIKIAIGSSSKNTPLILERIGLTEVFDAISDGNNIKKSKPDPEVFVKAAQMLEVECEKCLVVEDADAGIEAGRAAGMRTLAVNGAKNGDYFLNDLQKNGLMKFILCM